MAETRMSIPEIIIFVFIAIILILIPLFLSFLNSRITVNIEDNGLRLAAYQIAENLLSSNIATNGGFLLDKLNELDGTNVEPVGSCYAYHVTLTAQGLKKNIWSFGSTKTGEEFSLELPVKIYSDTDFPANFKLAVYDTKEERCKK